ncbi:MAG: putative toxin-antitoxin system toxin component, PIN family [Candidatus Binataceae bacterium]
MIRVVLDTNVVVSAHLNGAGLEALVFDLATAGRVRLCVSASILEEYAEVLSRDKFKLPSELLAKSLARVRAAAQLVVPRRSVAAASDPADNRFLECAEAARAGYLITGNRRHFPLRWGRTRVVNAREFIALAAPILKR